jgi:hypothetical protein
MRSEAKNCKTTRCWQQKSAYCVEKHQKPRGSVVTACGQEKHHHKLCSSSNLEKNMIPSSKKKSKFLNTRKLRSRKFLVAADFFFANIFVTKKWFGWIMGSIFHLHIAPWHEWMVLRQMMLKTFLTPQNTKLLASLSQKFWFDLQSLKLSSNSVLLLRTSSLNNILNTDLCNFVCILYGYGYGEQVFSN